MAYKPYQPTAEEIAYVAALNEPWKPNGHSPVNKSTGWIYLADPDTEPEKFAKLQAEQDKIYFQQHPEEREEYQYKGP